MGNIRCNQCGNLIRLNEGDHREDCLKVVKEWGYFSHKDCERHEFYLCEACYDRLIHDFMLSVHKCEVEEVL